MDYTDRLKELRADNDYSQEKLAEMLNVSQRSYSYYETGNRDMPIKLLIGLVKIFDVPADYILGLTDKKERK